MNILDPNFKWVPAIETDIRKTFARVDPQDDWKSRIEGALRAMKVIQAERTANLLPIPRPPSALGLK